MTAQETYRVFVVYTAEDLAPHADVVVSVLRKLQVIAVDHRDSGATGEPSVEWCMREIDRAYVVIAYRKVAIASVTRVIDRFLEGRPELDAARWKHEHFPELEEWRTRLSK